MPVTIIVQMRLFAAAPTQLIVLTQVIAKELPINQVVPIPEAA